MITCSRCGTQNAPHLATCALCGSALAQPAATPPGQRDFGRTVQLNAPLVSVPPAPPLQSDAPPRAPAAPRAGLGGTMLGIPAIDQQGSAPSAGRSPGAERGPAAHQTLLGTGTPEAGSPGKYARTVIGMAAPEHLPPGQRPAPQAPDPGAFAAPPTSPASSASPASGALPHTKTILGVARPGIAPLNPGMVKAAVPEVPAYPSPPPPPGIADDASAAARRGESLRAARQSSRMALVAVAGAGMLLALAAVLFFVFRGPGAIEGRAVLDAQGKEQLELSCADCDDGTRVRLGAHAAEFKARRATLKLERELNVGENRFTLGVAAPNSERESRVELSVPLEYRVRADLSALTETPPRLRVRVDAAPGSSVRVDNRAVALGPAGKASADIDVSAELTGTETAVRRLERRVAYSVKPPDGTTQNGEVAFQLGIVPLSVDAPGESVTTDAPTFVLAGRTVKGGEVSVEGRALQVTPDGRFAQAMSVSQIGETTVTLRASAPEHAPRLFAIRVRRVASLAEEAARQRLQATTSYSAIASDIERKRGWKVALDGSVVEHRPAEHSSLFLLDARGGCAAPPCLVRVVYGARATLAEGDRVSVFGRVLGAVEGPRTGTKIPEIVADFVIGAKR